MVIYILRLRLSEGDDGVEVERIVQKNDTNEDGSDNEQWDNTRPMLSHWDFHVIPYRVI